VPERETAPVTAINVGRRGRGGWEVAVPGRSERLICETLDGATRAGHRSAADLGACELIVHDAYHRVVQHERLDGRDGSGAVSSGP
jgi:hypothetical protein